MPGIAINGHYTEHQMRQETRSARTTQAQGNRVLGCAAESCDGVAQSTTTLNLRINTSGFSPRRTRFLAASVAKSESKWIFFFAIELLKESPNREKDSLPELQRPGVDSPMDVVREHGLGRLVRTHDFLQRGITTFQKPFRW
jgi:hypothetical protein